MEITQMKTGHMDVFSYLVACPETRNALVIDPGGDEELIFETIQHKRYELLYVVNTHGHVDHTCGNYKLKGLTGAKIVMHRLDDELFNSQGGQAMARQWGFTPSPPAAWRSAARPGARCAIRARFLSQLDRLELSMP